MQFTLNVNGKAETVDVEPETPLLWVLRDTIGLTGTKYGCGISRCGSCTIHVDGQPTKACQLPASARSANGSPPSRGCRATARTRCRKPG
jgi:isoquinoline 1-oxidoreductase alpha subunit